MYYRRLRKYKYQLMEDFSIKVDCTLVNLSTDWIKIKYNCINIQKGYCWDGATCAIDTHSFMVPSLVHDALYQLIRTKNIDIKYKKEADNILHSLCLQYGMSRIRAWYVHMAVKLFGGKTIHVGIPQDIIYEVKQ